MHTPLFWKEKTFLSTALVPMASLYGWYSKCRQTHIAAHTLPIPVICIGNAIVGGAGKTPVALAIGALMKAQKRKVHYLSRGYKGSLRGPIQVNPSHHSAKEVGDEPLLLAEILPTWVAKDKIAGAKAAINAGAEWIIMDDGFQNPHIYKDISLLVIDGEYGFGNERLIPAGPLRETIPSAMERASAILLLGEDKCSVSQHAPPGKTVLRATVEPTSEALSLQDKHVIAFAGIAHPRKFYRTLQQLNCVVKKMIAYPDHHHFTAKDIADLLSQAKEHDAQLVTTAKDYVRLPANIRAKVIAVPIEIVFGDEIAVLQVIGL